MHFRFFFCDFHHLSADGWACWFAFRTETCRMKLHVQFLIKTINLYGFVGNFRLQVFFSSENDAKTPSCCLFNGNNKHRKRVKILRKRAKLQQLKSVSGKTLHEKQASGLKSFGLKLEPSRKSRIRIPATSNRPLVQPDLKKSTERILGWIFQSEGVLGLITLFSLNRNKFSSGFWRPTHAWNLCLLGG